MGFDLHHRRLDPCSRNDLSQLLQFDICYPNRLAPTLVHEALQRSPRLDQRDLGIIDYLTMLVPRVMLFAGSKGERGMDEIAIDIVDLQSPAAGVKRGLDPVRTMIGVP